MIEDSALIAFQVIFKMREMRQKDVLKLVQKDANN